MELTLKKNASREKKLMMQHKLKAETADRECMTDIGQEYFAEKEEWLNNNSSTNFGTVNPHQQSLQVEIDGELRHNQSIED